MRRPKTMTKGLLMSDPNAEAWAVFTATLEPTTLESERWSHGIDAKTVARDERFGAARHHVMVHNHTVRARAFRAQVEREALTVRRVYRFTDAQLRVALRAQDAVSGSAGGLGAVFSPTASEYQSEGRQPVRKRCTELQSERGAA